MIDDDATPEELDAWYRRTPDQIAAEKADRWNAAWSALRLPDDQAYEPDDDPSTSYAAQPADEAPTGDAVDAAAKTGGVPPPPPPAKSAWANQDLGLLDVLASGEAPGYDVLATQPGHPLRHLPLRPDGQTDYSGYPNSMIQYVNKQGHTVTTSAAGRYQINKGTWDDLVKRHPDLSDFTPLNQDKAAWYLAADTYRTTAGRDLSSDLTDERYWPQITSKLAPKWASLPGSSKPQMTQDQFNQRLRDATARYRDPNPDN
jgi:muramidase (phage lysozyme)